MSPSPYAELLLSDPERISWDDLQVFDWIRVLHTCPQDPVHHAEGNVGIHTRMVLETLMNMPSYRALSPSDRQLAFLGCLMHDVGKPAATRLEADGSITSRGHSRAGELFTRRVFWELGIPFDVREQVCGLVRFHQIPFFLLTRGDAQRVAAEVSLSTRCDLLAVVAEADHRGRICRDGQRVIDNIELFREFCKEEGCFDAPRRFASAHTRYVYFHSEGRLPDVEAWDDTRTQVLLMSGLPGSGKDTYVREHLGDWPMVSLDALRAELEVDPRGEQGAVVQAAREQAREYLRRGQPFVWNATNLNRQRRTPIVSMAIDYGARVRIVYVEVPATTLFAQNRSRAAVVPENAIRRMTERWEIPNLTEAHECVLAIR